MAKFKVGDKVDIRRGARWHGGQTATVTVVDELDTDMTYRAKVVGGDELWVMTDDIIGLTAEPVAVAPATATVEHKFKVGDTVNNDYNVYTVSALITKYGKPAVEYTDGGWDFESGIRLVHRDEPAPIAITLDIDLNPALPPQVGDAVLIPGYISAINQSHRGTNYNIVFETQNRRVSLHFLEEDFILDEDGDDDGDCPCANDNGPAPSADTAKAFDALGDWLRAVAINPSAAFRANKEAA